MADHTQLIKRLRRVGEDGCDPDLPHDAADAIEAQAREIEALRVNDARYRWLRDNGMYGAPRIAVKDGYGGQELAMGEYLDAALDAAMPAEQKGAAS